jgi:adenosyl cobinamide kinase/adenosyl cobinamide phosphate guanylyltransferase
VRINNAGGTHLILIFGGAYQGKLQYALERYCLTEADVCQCDDTVASMPKGKIVNGLDKWILALVKAGMNAEAMEAEIRRLTEQNLDAIIICDDISCGVVPVDADLRKWREAAGRSLMMLSHSADEVIRLFCGIPTILK